MSSRGVRILLIEGDPAQASVLRDALTAEGDVASDVEIVDRLEPALDTLRTGNFSIVLLDLCLPGTRGLDSFVRVHAAAPDVAILVLAGPGEETLAVRAVQEGAHGYLVRDRVDDVALRQSVIYALQRQRMLEEAARLALADALTGLRNRRALIDIAEHHIRLAGRTKETLTLLLFDVQGLGEINDRFGHREGDTALLDTAALLTDTFRESDVVARLGGDAFSVLMTNNPEGAADIALERLRSILGEHNAQARRPYPLVLKVGTAHYDPLVPCSVPELFERAEQAMSAAEAGDDGAAKVRAIR
ncbi:MAG TPA: GGDEF domain-containing response regulator [Egibacteraceae bacterium]|nr:GGDEF domain-containing response regulator [Egibacteraceae bacterium]